MDFEDWWNDNYSQVRKLLEGDEDLEASRIVWDAAQVEQCAELARLKAELSLVTVERNTAWANLNSLHAERDAFAVENRRMDGVISFYLRWLVDDGSACASCGRTHNHGCHCIFMPPYQNTAREVERVKAMEAELQNIANAKPQEWEPDMRDQFREWAQNRARAALGAVGKPK